jgi:hypothetical protein
MVGLEKHAAQDCALRASPDKRVGLYYMRFSETAFNPQAHLRSIRTPKNPVLGVQLRNFG